MLDPGLLVAIQAYSTPFLDSFFSIVTHLGHEYSYILFLVVVYWCIDRRIAHRGALLLLFSMWLNGLVKEAFALPRPSAPQGVRILAEEHSFGFPSGHSQGAVTLWGYLAWSFRSRLFWIVAIALILLIGFSRLYLGAHFLVDVVGGYAIGLVLVVVWVFLGRAGVASSLPRGLRFFLALLVPVALFPLYQSSASVQTLGFLLGVAASDVFALDLIRYDPRGGVLRQAAKLLIGFLGFAGLYIFHRHLPDGAAEALGYAVMAVWITVIAPWLFVRLGLARGSEPPQWRGGAGHLRPMGGISWTPTPRLYPSGRMERQIKGFLLGTAAVSVALGALVITHQPHPTPVAPVLASLAPERPIVVGHRGAAGLAPENTWLAIQLGLAHGVDVIEIDVQLTADGHLVLMHDERVDRTTDGSGLVRELTLAQIEALDAGYWFSSDGGETYPVRGIGLRVPTLDETLQAFPDTMFIIEIKGSDPRAADAVAQAVQSAQATRRVLIGGFDTGVVKRFREVLPDVPTTATQREVVGFFLLTRFGLTAFAKPQWDVLVVPPKHFGWLPVINQGLIEAAADHDRPVFAFTINDPHEARRLLALGIQGIITDRPDLIVSLAH